MRKKLNCPSHQKGAAIIVALFVTALVAAAAIAMIERLKLDIKRTELILNHRKAYYFAQGSVAWAIDQLNTNLKQKKPDTLIDNIPILSPTNTIDNVTINTEITDQLALFNINNLKDPEMHLGFIHFVKTVLPELQDEEIKQIALAIQHWIAATSTNNTLDDYYAKQIPAYRAPHKPMVSVSELRLVKGVTGKIYTTLAPFLTALPEATLININTASAQVLTSLSPTMALDAAQAIVSYRKSHPFLTPESFLKFDVVKNNSINEKKIITTSDYFLVKSNVKVDTQHLTLYTLLHRLLNNAEPIELIIWQSKGTL